MNLNTSRFNNLQKKKISTEESILPPNRVYLKLTYTKNNAANGFNKCIEMQAIPEKESFSVTTEDTGVRWNNQKKTTYYPMINWDEVYKQYIQQGWHCYCTEKMGKITIENHNCSMDGNEYLPLQDSNASILVAMLTSFANKMVEEDYNLSIENVPESAFINAEKLLDGLALTYEKISNADFNNLLEKLFMILPRRMKKVSDYLAPANADALQRAEIIQTERDRLDVLKTVVKGVGTIPNGKETILEAYGMEIRAFTSEEMSFVKTKLARDANKLVRGWRVINHKTEKCFNNFCKNEKLTEENGISFLFHGSRHENWWSIITNGLTINPVGVIICGKMFGNGTYFAPDACKSLGYTSMWGSRWANGSNPTGFLGIYKVATGNCYEPTNSDSSLNYQKLQSLQKGAHCTWCKRGGQIGLRMDEVIVYKDEQSTVWGILEMGN